MLISFTFREALQ